MSRRVLFLIGFFVSITVFTFLSINSIFKKTPSQTQEITPNITSSTSLSPTLSVTLATPTQEFKTRITKKFFGTFVTSTNSPVSPERFIGYHTGVDVEYGDVAADVPVFAVSDGLVVTSKYASGYGGVMVINKEVFKYITNDDIMLEADDGPLSKLAKMKEVAVFPHDGFWHCMDSYRDYLNLNKLWNKNPIWKIWK